MRHHPSDQIDHKKSHGAKALHIIGMVFAGFIFAIFFALLFGLLVMVLWNWLMPAIFGLGQINFWQAFGIVLLAKILFSGFGHRSHDPHHYFEKRMKLKLHGRFDPHSQDCCHEPGNGDKWKKFRRFWDDEGKAAFHEYMKESKDIPEESEEDPS